MRRFEIGDLVQISFQPDAHDNVWILGWNSAELGAIQSSDGCLAVVKDMGPGWIEILVSTGSCIRLPAVHLRFISSL